MDNRIKEKRRTKTAAILPFEKALIFEDEYLLFGAVEQEEGKNFLILPKRIKGTKVK